MTQSSGLQVALIGSGMIAHDQILPSLYHLQREGIVGDIRICARHSRSLRELAEAPALKAAFPGQSFAAHPKLTEDPHTAFPELHRKVIAELAPRQLVVVAVPDTQHFEVVMTALEHDQHVLCVKPLVLRHADAVAIETAARKRGLFVGVEYHKRFDRRSLEARGSYRAGRFGEFKCGEAKLVEPWYYRQSNFQTWFTKENTDPFTYIGCHYVDLVHFITGLLPVEVSVRGVEGKFPNGNVGWLWSHARVTFGNGAVLGVLNGLGYPDEAAGSNDQAMCLFCEGKEGGAQIKHDDQFRGVSHSYVRGSAPFPFRYVSPDYMRLVPWEGKGLRPVGYGYESVAASVLAAVRIEAETKGMPADKALARRRALAAEIDDQGLIATPANSSFNELVVEAGRLSIAHGGRPAAIAYGKAAGVKLV